MFKAVIDSFGRYRAFKNTERELSRLTDRELRDIGISRYEIPSIAARRVFVD